MNTVKIGLLAALTLALATPGFAQGPINSWTGSASTDWNTPANWSAGRVPTATDDVLINGPSVAQFNPSVTGTVNAGNITLGSGSVLFIGNTGTVRVAGNFTNQAGMVTGMGRGKVELVGVSEQTIGGTVATSFRNLSVGPAGAVTSTPVVVERGLTLRGNLTVGFNQTVGVLSTAIGPGYVVNDGGTVIGAVSVQRYIDPSINPGYGYRHLSSPVANTTFNTLQGPGYTPIFNPAYNSGPDPQAVTPYPTVFGYDQSRSGTVANNLGSFDQGYYSPQANDRMVPGRGYTVNLPGAVTGQPTTGTVVTFTGNLNTGNINSPITNSGNGQGGWQLLGNPYPAPLDWNGVFANPATSGVAAGLYVYKSTGTYAGTFSSYVNGIGTNGGTNVLPLGQAYFIYANGNGNVAYANSARLSSDSTLLQRSLPLTGTRLMLTGASRACESVVYFQSGATAGYDANLDAVALPSGTLRLTTATVTNSHTLSINANAELVNQDVLVSLSAYTPSAGTYQLTNTEGTLPAGYHVYLVDAQGTSSRELTAGAAIPLTLTAGNNAGRFALIFTKAASPLAAKTSAAAVGLTLYPNPATSTVRVSLAATAGPCSAEVLNALGQVVSRHELPTTGGEISLDGRAPGVYSVRLKTAAGTLAQRLIVQ